MGMNGRSKSEPAGKPVWLVTSNFEPRGSSLYTLRLATRLPAHGYDPTIICESATAVSPRVRAQLRLVEVPGLRHLLTRSWRVRNLVREFAETPPLLVHAQRRSLDLPAAELAERFGCPYVQSIQNLVPPGSALHVLPERIALVIAVSPTVKRDLVGTMGLPADLVEVIPNGVECSADLRLPEPRPAGKTPVVGTAGALEPAKGLTYFLLAAELILSSGLDAEFLVVGMGPEEEVLRRAARHLDISNRVTFVNNVEDYAPLLAPMDVFVNPALEQGLGTITLEAMALGKPIVATQVGGVADFLVDGEHALLVPPAHHVVLAEKITYLLDNPVKARNLAAQGQQMVRSRFSVDEMAARVADAYTRVLGES